MTLSAFPTERKERRGVCSHGCSTSLSAVLTHRGRVSQGANRSQEAATTAAAPVIGISIGNKNHDIIMCERSWPACLMVTSLRWINQLLSVMLLVLHHKEKHIHAHSRVFVHIRHLRLTTGINYKNLYHTEYVF